MALEKPTFAAPQMGLCVCVCTVPGHERRGSLPTTCGYNSTWSFQAREVFMQGAEAPIQTPLLTKLVCMW